MRLRRRAVQQAVVVKASASALSAVSSTKPKESAVPFWKQAALIAAKEEKKLQKKLAKAAAKAEAAAEAEASLASASHASEDGSSLPPVSRPNSSRGKRGDGRWEVGRRMRHGSRCRRWPAIFSGFEDSSFDRFGLKS